MFNNQFLINELIKSLEKEKCLISAIKFNSGRAVQLRLSDNKVFNIMTCEIKDKKYIVKPPQKPQKRSEI